MDDLLHIVTGGGAVRHRMTGETGSREGGPEFTAFFLQPDADADRPDQGVEWQSEGETAGRLPVAEEHAVAAAEPRAAPGWMAEGDTIKTPDGISPVGADPGGPMEVTSIMGEQPGGETWAEAVVGVPSERTGPRQSGDREAVSGPTADKPAAQRDTARSGELNAIRHAFGSPELPTWPHAPMAVPENGSGPGRPSGGAVVQGLVEDPEHGKEASLARQDPPANPRNARSEPVRVMGALAPAAPILAATSKQPLGHVIVPGSAGPNGQPTDPSPGVVAHGPAAWRVSGPATAPAPASTDIHARSIGIEKVNLALRAQRSEGAEAVTSGSNRDTDMLREIRVTSPSPSAAGAESAVSTRLPDVLAGAGDGGPEGGPLPGKATPINTSAAGSVRPEMRPDGMATAIPASVRPAADSPPNLTSGSPHPPVARGHSDTDDSRAPGRFPAHSVTEKALVLPAVTSSPTGFGASGATPAGPRDLANAGDWAGRSNVGPSSSQDPSDTIGIRRPASEGMAGPFTSTPSPAVPPSHVPRESTTMQTPLGADRDSASYVNDQTALGRVREVAPARPLAAEPVTAPVILGGQNGLGSAADEDASFASSVPSDARPAAAANAPVAAATATASAPASLAVARQIVHAMAEAAGDRAGVLELALDPPELGRVRLTLGDGPGGMTLHIQTDRPETADLMRRHLSVLTEEFQRAGLDAPDVDISGHQGRRSHPDTRASDDTVPPGTDVAPTAPHSAAASASHTTTDALDLRL